MSTGGIFPGRHDSFTCPQHFLCPQAVFSLSDATLLPTHKALQVLRRYFARAALLFYLPTKLCKSSGGIFPGQRYSFAYPQSFASPQAVFRPGGTTLLPTHNALQALRRYFARAARLFYLPTKLCKSSGGIFPEQRYSYLPTTLYNPSGGILPGRRYSFTYPRHNKPKASGNFPQRPQIKQSNPKDSINFVYVKNPSRNRIYTIWQ